LAPSSKLHDLHPENPPTNLHWTVPVDPASLVRGEGGRSATLTVTNLAVVDTPKFPFNGPSMPATVSYTIAWRAMEGPFALVNGQGRYRAQFFKAEARIGFSATIPSMNFTFQSDPAESSQSPFAILAREVNGVYFDQLVQQQAR